MDAQPILISQEVLITAGISLIVFLIGFIGTLAAFLARMLKNWLDSKFKQADENLKTCHKGLVKEIQHIVDYDRETRKIAIEAHGHISTHIVEFHAK